MPAAPEQVEICDVSPRDGLQSDAVIWSTEQKLQLVDHLLDAGVRRLEVASFVTPKRVPAMADGEAVCAGLPRDRGATFVGLVLNERGMDRAVAAGVDEVNVVVLCTDTFADRNQATTVEGSIATWHAVAKRAAAEGIAAQVVVSVAFGCPYEGEVPTERVAEVVRACADAGATRLTLADTIGAAAPGDIRRVLDACLPLIPEGTTPAVHLHNSRGTGVAGAWVAHELGIRSFDASLGGIGGCPFAPGATGNVCTEDLAYAFERSGIPTGLDLDRLLDASRWLGDELGRTLPSNYAKAGPFPKPAPAA